MIRGRNWDAYCDNFTSRDPRVEAFTKTATEFHSKVIEKFDHKSRLNGLLYGEVQSGKTSHTFALLASVADADEGFRTFVYFSTDNVPLQEQTLRRGFQDLSETFELIGESDEIRFQNIRDKKPCLIVLKKNTRVLQRWLDVLSNSRRVNTGPIFLVDDEGDAASPNTKVNKDDESEIYKKIQSFRELGTSSILLQVTATPQALFLQQEIEGLRPNFVQFFEPGKNYLGGDFYFSKIDTNRNVFVDEDDLEQALKMPNFTRSTGLLRAITTFVVTCAYFQHTSRGNANALFHPSVNTGKHHEIAIFARSFLSWLDDPENAAQSQLYLRSAYDDLHRTLEETFTWEHLLSNMDVLTRLRVVEMNSTQNSERGIDLEQGFNIIVGGNTLGRGVTFPHLQTVYYTRQARRPQADTFWQHARMFGYDRDKTAIRIFMPLELFVLFNVLQESNSKLAHLVKSGDLRNLQVILPGGVKPTRGNVIRQSAYSLLVGGTNLFPPSPDQDNGRSYDQKLKDYDDKLVHEIEADLAKQLIKEASKESEWPANKIIRALDSAAQAGVVIRLLVSRSRNLGRTGTMLSEDDRRRGESLGAGFVLTAYRVQGDIKKGWLGKQFWLLNVRLPDGFVYHQVN